MKFKNSDLEAMISSMSYRKFFTAEFDDILLVFEIRHQHEALQSALKAYITTKKTLAERFCDKDLDTQKLIMGPNGEYRFTQNPLGLQNFRDQFNELLDMEIEVEASKVKVSMSALKSVGKWSGADLSIIYPFIEICEDDEKQDARVKLVRKGK